MTNKSLAILGMILSIVLGGVPGLVVSAVALKKMKDSGDEDGKGFAIAGLVLGIVSTAMVVIVFGCVCGAGACAVCAAGQQ